MTLLQMMYEHEVGKPTLHNGRACDDNDGDDDDDETRNKMLPGVEMEPTGPPRCEADVYPIAPSSLSGRSAFPLGF